MENVLQEKLTKAESYIENNDYLEALKLLRDLAINHPDDGKIAYDLAIIAMKTNDNIMAMQYFDAALEKGFENANLYFHKIRILNDIGETEEIEPLFERALEISENDDETWALLDEQINYFLSNDLILNADKIAKTMIQKYPNEYAGYHYHFLAKLEKEKYEDAKACLEIIPKELQDSPLYLIDTAEYYRIQDNDYFYTLLESDNRYKEQNPIYYYKNIYHKACKDDDAETMLSALKKLSFEFGDQDSFLSLIMLLHSAQMFTESAEVANLVIEANKEEANIYFFYAMFYQMYNYYHLEKNALTEETIKWIIDAGNWCVSYANSTGKEEIIENTISSVNYLFEQLEKLKKEV